MSNVKKFKLNTKKKQNAVKRGIIIIGVDGETQEHIYMNAKTTSAINKPYNSMISKIYDTYKIPKKLKNISMLNKEEKELFDMLGQEIKNETFFTIYDDTNPKYKEVATEIKTMKVFADAIACFDMDALNPDEDDDDKEITHWERFKIQKGNWFALLKFLINEDTGLGLNLANIQLIINEMKDLKIGNPTLAEKILFAEEGKEIKRGIIDDLSKDINAVIKKQLEEEINKTEEGMEDESTDEKQED